MNANTVFFGRGHSEEGRALNALRKTETAKRVRSERRIDWRKVMSDDE
jgi:hypothetical protein